MGHEKLTLRTCFSAAGGSAGASVGAGASSSGGSVGGGASVAPQPASTIESTKINVVRANSFFISFLLCLSLERSQSLPRTVLSHHPLSIHPPSGRAQPLESEAKQPRSPRTLWPPHFAKNDVGACHSEYSRHMPG